MNLREQMDAIYSGHDLDEIPWNRTGAPAALRALVDSGWQEPCDAVDLGCGAGNQAVWLARLGFRVTGLDLSTCAIEHARKLASRSGVECRFLARDLTEEQADLVQSFDFAFDWSLLHHLVQEQREVYANNVHRLLRPGGRYYSLCFSEQEAPRFYGSGKSRQTALGTRLYFSSEQELRALFEPFFHIEGMRTIEVEGKPAAHMAVEARMRRRDL